MRQADGRVPVHLADADREGDHDLGLALLDLGVVVEAMLGQVHDDPGVRGVRQNVPARHEHGFVGTRNPRVQAWIDADQLFGAQAVVTRQIVERVLIDRLDFLILADDSELGVRELIDARQARSRDTQ